MVDRRTALTLALAFLAVLALGVSAATLDSASSASASDGVGAGSQEGSSGVGADEDGAVDLSDRSAAAAELELNVCVKFLTRLDVQLALLGIVFLFFLFIYRTTGSGLLSGMFTLSLTFPFAVLYYALSACGQARRSEQAVEFALGFQEQAQNNSSILPSGGGSAGLGQAGETLSTPSTVLGILIVVAIIGSVALLFISTDDDDAEIAEEPPEPSRPERMAAVGARAGLAADQIEADADVENAVYQAWQDMTAHLSVERPESSTPAEFAAAAVDAGMDRQDVEELTRLFEEVRYGEAEPTTDRERRAVAALRRIESEYADPTEGRSIAEDPPAPLNPDTHRGEGS